MKKEKLKLILGTAMLIGCMMSPILLSFLVTDKHLYVKADSTSMGFIMLSLFFGPIVIGSLFKDGVTEANVFSSLWAMVAVCVGLISSLASPWYILISLFGVISIFLFKQ